MSEEQLTIENVETADQETAEEKQTPTAGSRPRLFYVQVTRLSDGKRMFIGEFDDREKANELSNSLTYEHGENYDFEPMGKIEARRNGMRSSEMGDKLNTLVNEFTVEETVWESIPAEEEKTKRGRPRNDGEDKGEHKTKSQKSERVGSSMAKHKEERVVIVTSSSGLIALLARNGIYGEFISEVRHKDEIEGAVVYGNLPPWWARYTSKYYVVNVPRLRDDQKGSNKLSPEDYINAGITLDEYVTEYKGSKSLK